MKLRWILLLLAFSHFVFTALPVDAVNKTITVTHTYVMGDNDSRNDARRLCFLEAKRKVLELDGMFIQSSSEVKNFELTKDQITSYSAAILSVETLHESFDFTKGQNALTLTVKAEVDIEETTKQLAAIASDTSLQQQMNEQLKKLLQLEEVIKRTSAQLARATPDQAGELREERNVVFADLAGLEKVYMVAKERITEERMMECDIANKMQHYVLDGMTKSEVSEILGEPFKKGQGIGADNVWYYGSSVVYFKENGRVNHHFPNNSCPRSK